MTKLNLWKENWDLAEAEWDSGAAEAKEKAPIRSLNVLPNMVGITPETAKNLKWKSLYWMATRDKGLKIFKGVMRHPLKYGLALVRSALQNKPYLRDGDFFLYGLKSVAEFEQLLENKDTLFVVGFSYCHKPFECPSGRFSADCQRDPDNLVCRQCFIGKALNALPAQNSIPLLIPTIHYVGEKIFDIVHSNPGKQVIFMITACEMTLEMFGDWGNMVGIKGVGVRLDGRICNTMKAFELSEQGVKPGLTVLLYETKCTLMNMIKRRVSI